MTISAEKIIRETLFELQLLYEVVSRSGYALVSNVLALRCARLVLGWVSVRAFKSHSYSC